MRLASGYQEKVTIDLPWALIDSIISILHRVGSHYAIGPQWSKAHDKLGYVACDFICNRIFAMVDSDKVSQDNLPQAALPS